MHRIILILLVACSSPPGTITLGSTATEVRQTLGTPTGITGGSWSYGLARVDLDDTDHVVGWTQMRPFGTLPVRVTPRDPAAAARGRRAGFTVGSSRDEVVGAQGTPTSILGTVWSYGTGSTVTFDGSGHVIGYQAAPLTPLHVR